MTLSTRDGSQPAARKPRAPRREENAEEAAPRERAPRGPKREEAVSYKDNANFGSLGDVLAGLKKK